MPPSIGLRSRSADPDRHQLDPLFLRLKPQPTLLHGFRWVAVGFSLNLDSVYLLPKIFINLYLYFNILHMYYMYYRVVHSIVYVIGKLPKGVKNERRNAFTVCT